jgi:hypothetical protein
VPRRSVERAELAVSDADVGVIQDNVVDESDSVAKEPPTQGAGHKAHRINVIGPHEPEAVVKAEPAPLEYPVQNVIDF